MFYFAKSNEEHKRDYTTIVSYNNLTKEFENVLSLELDHINGGAWLPHY